MMPGVVAGFPRRAIAGGITLLSEEFSGDPGVSGFDKYYPRGSINPPFASIVPEAPAVEGASGELLGFLCVDAGGGQFELFFGCLGSFSATPFSTVSIDGQVYSSSKFSPTVEGGSTTFGPVGYVPSNVLAAGPHTIVFA